MYGCSAGHQKAFIACLLHRGEISGALKSLVKAGRFEEGHTLVAAIQGTSGEMAGLLLEQKMDQLQDYLTQKGCVAEADMVSTAQLA